MAPRGHLTVAVGMTRLLATKRDTPDRHRPRKRAIQHSEAPAMESKGRGVPDAPLGLSSG
jgi:hypothetical protein